MRALVYLWGGDYCAHSQTFPGRCASREYLWSYDVSDRWEMLVDENTPTAGFPRGRCLPGMAYDSRRRVLWMSSGSERFGNYVIGLVSVGAPPTAPKGLRFLRGGVQ